MSRHYIISLILLLLTGIDSHSQKIATLEVDLSKTLGGLEVPVSVNLDDITFLADSSLSLLMVQGTKRTAVTFQIMQGDQRTLHWLVKPGEQKKLVYELVKGTKPKDQEVVAELNAQSLTVRSGEKNLLRYVHETLYPPAGVDTAYKRSGFIHPLWSPHGQELTRIQPPDHYHHYGIWNPWTHVLYKGDTIDFWNIAGRKGTVSPHCSFLTPNEKFQFFFG